MPILICPSCGKEYEKLQGDINQAKKRGLKLFCTQSCFGLSRRKNQTVDQKKAAKAQYDKEYREKNDSRIRQHKKQYFQKTYDPEKERVKRAATMQQHIEYCRKYYAIPENTKQISTKTQKIMEQLTGKNLKKILWETLNEIKEKKIDPGAADAIASQAREIVRTAKVQLQISAMSKREVPAELIAFNEGA